MNVNGSDSNGRDIADRRTEPATIEYLRIQANYMMQHLRLADSKAAVIIAYCGATLGITLQEIGQIRSTPLFVIGLIGVALNAVAAAAAVYAVLPRFSRTSRDSADNFSWLCLPEQDGFYADRIMTLSREGLIQGIAETMEGLALLLHKKYRLVQMAIWVAAVGAPMHLVVWAT